MLKPTEERSWSKDTFFHLILIVSLVALVPFRAPVIASTSSDTSPASDTATALPGPRPDEKSDDFKIQASWKEIRSREMIRQKHEYTCGAASMATVMNLFPGNDYTEAEALKTLEGKSIQAKKIKNGRIPALSVANLNTIAKKFDFKTLAFKAFQNKLRPGFVESVTPMVTRLVIGKNNPHYVVVRAVEDNWVFIADPAYGNFRIPWSDFVHFWKRGGRIFVAVSQKRFLYWKEKDGRLYVKRQEGEQISKPDIVNPYILRESSLNTLTLSGSLGSSSLR